jgi:hypothetical protein
MPAVKALKPLLWIDSATASTARALLSGRSGETKAMAWKSMSPLITGSAALALGVGFVWLKRSFGRKSEPALRAFEVHTLRPGRFEPGAFAPEPMLDGEALEQAARIDALHDLGGDEDELDDGEAELDAVAEDDELDLDTARDPQDIDGAALTEMTRPAAHAQFAEEPYDALDAEDVGTEWLLRATQAEHVERPSTSEPFQGGHVFDPALGEGDRESMLDRDSAFDSDSAFGSDQKPVPRVRCR